MEVLTPDPSASGGGSGPRACRACATSKAKCVFMPASVIGDKCRRCNRLNKECVMQTPAVRKRQPRTATRVDQLEEKLDGLVSLLKPPQQVLENSGANGMAIQSPYHPPVQKFPDTPSSNPSISRSPGQETQDSPNTENVFPDALLYIFRNNMAPQFPFVIIPERISTAELAQSKPFLYKVVLMVASYHDKAAQSRMTEEIFQYLSANMIIANEKSLDLLQGLLILMAWYHFHISVARRLTLMLHLAGSLIIDLGLSSTSSTRAAEQMTESSLATFLEDIPIPKEPTSEECRAILGLNYMSSVIYTFVKDIEDTPRTNDFTEKCLQVIEANAEYRSDDYLVQLLKMQSITEEINEALPRHRKDFSSGSSAPVSLCMRTLQAKLDSFRMKLPLHLQQNPYLLMNYHSLLTYLTETALSIPLSTRQATLHACLTSTHAFFSFLFSIPLMDYYKLTYATWSQMRHILVVLYKLSSFESPDWDPSHVREILDLSIIIQNIISQFERVQMWSSKNGSAQEDGFLFRLIPRLREYKEAFEMKRAFILGEAGPPSTEVSPLPIEDLMFGQLDDNFWQEIIADANWLPPVDQNSGFTY